MNENKKILNEMLYSSKKYEVKGSILTLINYNTGDRIKLDLSVLLDNEEVLDEMVERAEEEWY